MANIVVGASLNGSFTIISNEFARNPAVTPRAARVFLYLMSNTEGWVTSAARISKIVKMSEGTVSSALTDLEALGYLRRVRKNVEGGRFVWEYHLFPTPQKLPDGATSENSENEQVGTIPQKTTSGKTTSGKLGDIRTPSSKNTKQEENQGEEPPVVPQGGPAPKPKRGHRLPEGWMPDQDVIEAMAQENPGVDLEREHAKFTDHFTAASGANASKQDWNAAWRNWIRRAADSYPARSQSRPQTREEKLRAWGAPSQSPVPPAPTDGPRELTW